MIAKSTLHRPPRGYSHRRNILFSLFFPPLLALSGCVAPGPLDDDQQVDFRLRGKIGVRGDPVGGFSASFDWVQAGDSFVIELWGPFGHGRTRLRGDGRTLTITDAYGATLVGDGPETLMREHLGWSAPVEVLGHWVRGLAAPDYPATDHERNAQGRLERFAQLGWTVELSRWRKSASMPLPGKVVAIRKARRVTVICREWSFG